MYIHIQEFFHFYVSYVPMCPRPFTHACLPVWCHYHMRLLSSAVRLYVRSQTLLQSPEMASFALCMFGIANLCGLDIIECNVEGGNQSIKTMEHFN